MADLETPVVATSDATAAVPAEVSKPAEPIEAGQGTDSQAVTEQGDTEHDGEPKSKRLGGWQRKQLKAEQERDFWREEALRARGVQPPPPAPPAPAEKPEPKPEDFAVGDGTYDVAAYTKAYNTFTREQVKAEIRSEMKKAEDERTQKASQQTAEEKYQQRQEAARTAHTDYDDTALEVVETLQELKAKPGTPVIATVLMQHDSGAAIEYYLGKHPEEIQRIAKLDPLAAVMALGQIEARIAGDSQAATEKQTPEAPPVTRAPKPPTPVSRPSASNAKSIYDPDISFKDYVRLRDAKKTS